MSLRLSLTFLHLPHPLRTSNKAAFELVYPTQPPFLCTHGELSVLDYLCTSSQRLPYSIFALQQFNLGITSIQSIKPRLAQRTEV